MDLYAPKTEVCTEHFFMTQFLKLKYVQNIFSWPSFASQLKLLNKYATHKQLHNLLNKSWLYQKCWESLKTMLQWITFQGKELYGWIWQSVSSGEVYYSAHWFV
jgi:hypothetical protein